MPSRSSVRVPSVDECREELRAILSSRVFHQAENLSRLLKYICDKTLSGEAESLTEYTIAVDVYSKPSGFRDQRDSSVRVDVYRLRKRLALYYEREGAGRALRIAIPVGGYVPDFQLNGGQAVAAEPSEQLPEGELISISSPVTNCDGPVEASARVVETEPSILPGPPRIREPVRSRLVPATLVVLLVLVVAPLIWILRGHVRATPQAGVSVQNYASAPATNAEVHILAGFSSREWKDAAGRLWQPDRYFKGGVARSVPRNLASAPPSRRLVENMREAGPGPTDDGAAFSYDIPLQPGVYELRLYFADPLMNKPPQDEGEDNQNLRIFVVTANGRPLLQHFDAVSDAGLSDVDVRAFKDIAPASDGKVHLSFLGPEQHPFVNAIELVPSRPGRANPIRIAARRTTYTDPQGFAWEPDNYFIHGRLVRHTGTTPSDFPELFRSERYGNFNYSIPVPEGHYTVTLYFAETFFDQLAPLVCHGPGCRVFDVSCNGTTLLRDFDVSQAAGGAFRPVVRRFTGLQPNGQGKLLISFSSSVNYAEVRAIEVVDETPQRRN